MPAAVSAPDQVDLSTRTMGLLFAAASLGIVAWASATSAGPTAAATGILVVGSMQAIHHTARPDRVTTAVARFGAGAVTLAIFVLAGADDPWVVALYVLASSARWTTQLAMVVLGLSGILLWMSTPTGPSDVLVAVALSWSVVFVASLLSLRADDLEQGARLRPLTGEDGAPPSTRGLAADIARIGAVLVLAFALLLPVLGTLTLPNLVKPDELGSGAGGEPAPGDGYFGFGDELDTRSRGDLSDKVVIRVQTDRPALWRGLTYDEWDGTTWTRSEDTSFEMPVDGDGSYYAYPGVGDDRLLGDWLVDAAVQDDFVEKVLPLDEEIAVEERVQVFEVERTISDVIVAEYQPDALQLPFGSVTYETHDASMRAPYPIPAGTTYTVTSRVPVVTAEVLRRNDPLDQRLVPEIQDRYLQLPDVPDRVEKLAEDVTRSAPTTYDKVRALEQWIEDNTEYNRDIPVQPEGMDAVEHHLFVEKAGFCEQIATSMTVMLRSLGVPARLAVGYTPGRYDRWRGSYEVKGSNAHAWVEVYFPGLGWQGFDPTAGVPLSGEERESTLDALWQSWRDNWVIILVGVVAAIGALVAGRLLARRGGQRGRRPRRAGVALTPAVLLERLEEAGARLGRPRYPDETVAEYGHALDAELDLSGSGSLVGALLTRAAFSSRGLSAVDAERIDATLTELEARPIPEPTPAGLVDAP